MAKRQALQELQKRIAHLLQEAGSQTADAASWLGVRLGQHKILLPLQQAGEIHPWNSQIQYVAYTKPWFLGVVALRGQVYSVIELTEFLTHIDKADITSPQKRRASRQKSQRLVALNEAFGVNAVLRVDALEGLHSQNSFIKSQPAEAGAPDYYGSIFHQENGTFWQEINMQALCQTPQFLDIAASMQPLDSVESPAAIAS